MRDPRFTCLRSRSRRWLDDYEEDEMQPLVDHDFSQLTRPPLDRRSATVAPARHQAAPARRRPDLEAFNATS